MRVRVRVRVWGRECVGGGGGGRGGGGARRGADRWEGGWRGGVTDWCAGIEGSGWAERRLGGWVEGGVFVGIWALRAPKEARF